MAQSRHVRISNSSLNSYGTRILTEGVDLEQYKRNPILLWMHVRAFRGTKDDVLPIGRVENINVEGDDITGDLVFDSASDDFAKSIEQKWDGGFLKMVSAAFDIVATDEDPALALPGQTYATITKSKLYEVSVADIGANDDSIVLVRNGKQVKLTSGIDNADLPTLKLNHSQKNKDMDFKTIALKLGLPETASEADILNKIGLILEYKTANEKLKTENDGLKLSAITTAVETAQKAGKFSLDKKEHFIELGKKVGLEELKIVLSAMNSVVKPMDLIGKEGGTISLSKEWKKLSEVPVEKINDLKANHKDDYIRLYKAEYGIVPDLD